VGTTPNAVCSWSELQTKITWIFIKFNEEALVKVRLELIEISGY
jgi:hypothetical protein